MIVSRTRTKPRLIVTWTRTRFENQLSGSLENVENATNLDLPQSAFMLTLQQTIATRFSCKTIYLSAF